jgi:hypothetical protein
MPSIDTQFLYHTEEAKQSTLCDCVVLCEICKFVHLLDIAAELLYGVLKFLDIVLLVSKGSRRLEFGSGDSPYLPVFKAKSQNCIF